MPHVENVFSMCMGAESGEIEFGGYDRTRMLAEPAYTSIVSKLYYTVALSGINVNGSDIPLTSEKNATTVASVIDSGTNSIYLSPSAYAAMIATLRQITCPIWPKGVLCDPEGNLLTVGADQCMYMRDSDFAQLPDITYSDTLLQHITLFLFVFFCLFSFSSTSLWLVYKAIITH